MPPRRQSDVNGSGEGPSEPRRRTKEGKEKETFGCSYPGCGQVSLLSPSPLAFRTRRDIHADDLKVYSRMEYLKRHQRKREFKPQN